MDIQLAVNKVLYQQNLVFEENDKEDNGDIIVRSEYEEEYLGSDDEFEIINHSSEAVAIQNISIIALIAKVRKIIVIFKRSPTKNDILRNIFRMNSKGSYH